MVEAEEQLDDSNFEFQEMEIESLQCIYLESEFEMVRERPYRFDIKINSNTEDESRNFLKLRITFDLQREYPNCVPVFRIKNLSPEYLDNRTLDKLEDEMREYANENLENMMIYSMCDILKQYITDTNDQVLS